MPDLITTRYGETVRQTIDDWTFNEENHEFDADLGIERYEYSHVETRPLTCYVLTVSPTPDDDWEITLTTRSRYGTTGNTLEFAPTRKAALGIADAYMRGVRTSRQLPP